MCRLTWTLGKSTNKRSDSEGFAKTQDKTVIVANGTGEGSLEEVYVSHRIAAREGDVSLRML